MRCLFASKLASHGRQICSEHFNLGQPSFDAGEVELLVSAVQKHLNIYGRAMNDWAAMIAKSWKLGDAMPSCSRNFRLLQTAELRTEFAEEAKADRDILGYAGSSVTWQTFGAERRGFSLFLPRRSFALPNYNSCIEFRRQRWRV
jgi:hypothetical protein